IPGPDLSAPGRRREVHRKRRRQRTRTCRRHMESERLKPILEAALLASPQPMTPARLADLFDEFERPTLDAIGHCLHALAEDCTGRGVELVEVGSGFRYQVRVDIFPHISALWTERQSRYSRALLETISLIAYRQPITR